MEVSHLKAWKKEYSSVTWRGPYDIGPIRAAVPPGALVLDVGCGSGKIMAPLLRAGYNVVGMDVAREGLLMVREGERIEGDARHLPFKDSSFDAVVCYDVLQHLLEAERQMAVAEIKRVLAPGGRVFVEVFGREDMRYGGTAVEPHTFRRESGIIYHYFSEAELLELLEGLEPRVESRLTRRVFRGEEHVRHRLFAAGKRQK
ncbi:class I SAM-dependent methyltransferase [Methanocella arvoryzae]|uniref:Methyltransferase n=1 Tax=Methanocella arvoryzae (strain DSM 22066 / NBRC 105507 / MRE50) TaxID=351160 RepID=Q0W7P6_METAR|nr:class I SAM-dependent methyltransferase [Methanocella arvoryzae]CAJ35597.2 putative methyltransferase [Methanocella arvoryzae MRE50]